MENELFNQNIKFMKDFRIISILYTIDFHFSTLFSIKFYLQKKNLTTKSSKASPQINSIKLELSFLHHRKHLNRFASNQRLMGNVDSPQYIDHQTPLQQVALPLLRSQLLRFRNLE